MEVLLSLLILEIAKLLFEHEAIKLVVLLFVNAVLDRISSVLVAEQVAHVFCVSLDLFAVGSFSECRA